MQGYLVHEGIHFQREPHRRAAMVMPAGIHIQPHRQVIQVRVRRHAQLLPTVHRMRRRVVESVRLHLHLHLHLRLHWEVVVMDRHSRCRCRRLRMLPERTVATAAGTVARHAAGPTLRLRLLEVWEWLMLLLLLLLEMLLVQAGGMAIRLG